MVFRAGVQNMLVRITNREHTDQTRIWVCTVCLGLFGRGLFRICWKGVQIYKGGFDLLILSDYFFFLILLKILHENEIILSQRGFPANHLNSSESATEAHSFF